MKLLQLIFVRNPILNGLEKELEGYYTNEILEGELIFSGNIENIELVWVDAHKRDVRKIDLKLIKKENKYKFQLNLDIFSTVYNIIEARINDKKILEQNFLLAPIESKFDDFHALVWAKYPYGYADELQKYGIDGEISYSSQNSNHVVKEFEQTYIDQVAPETIAYYHRRASKGWDEDKQPIIDYINDESNKIEPYSVRRLRDLQTRKHCLSEEGTKQKIANRLKEVVEIHRKKMPLFYNIVDEWGVGGQAAPNDLCYGDKCMEDFRREIRKQIPSLTELNKIWGTSFKNWSMVFPLSTTETIARNKKSKLKNFAAWMTHRSFMDSVMSNTINEARRVGKNLDIHGTFGSTGLQAPNAFGGFDYEKIVRANDLLIPYNMGSNYEIMRSLNPKLKTMSPHFGDSMVLKRILWYHLFHGDKGFLFWDNQEADGKFLNIPNMKPTYRAKQLGPSLREMKSGIGKALINSKRHDDGIAIHYSQSSIQAHWMLENTHLGKKWINRSSFDEFNFNKFRERRESLVFGIEDCGFQHHFISYKQIEDGKLNIQKEKILFFPGSSVLSELEISEIKKYVENGGIIVADNMLGIFSSFGVEQEVGSLDSFFGIKRSKTKIKANTIKLDNNIDQFSINQKIEIKTAENIKAQKDAKAFGKSASTDAFIIKEHGKGKAIYLNMNLENYISIRHESLNKNANDIQFILKSLMSFAGINRRIDLKKSEDFTHVPGIETTTFLTNEIEYACFVYSTVSKLEEGGGGLGGEIKDFDLKPYDKNININFSFPKLSHVYNLRKGKYLGFIDSYKLNFKPLDALIFSFIPYKVLNLDLKFNKSIKVGNSIDFNIKINTDSSEANGHVISYDIFDANGKWIYYYSGSKKFTTSKDTITINTALNDIKGKWKIRIKDITTGIINEQHFDLN